MRRWSDLPRPILYILALILASAATLYSGVWMYYMRHVNPRVEFGFDNRYEPSARDMLVLDVYKSSPAESAGLRKGDRIIAVNGRALDTTAPFDETWGTANPGDAINVTILRPGASQPVEIHGVFRARTIGTDETLGQASAIQVIASFPVLFIVVGFPVLFLRVDDADAWLLALFFASFLAAPGFPPAYGLSLGLRKFCYVYRAIAVGLIGPLFYTFFAGFPTRSAIDRRVPWLKWLALALGLWLGVTGVTEGVQDPRPPQWFVAAVGINLSRVLVLSVIYGFIALGLISLTLEALRSSDPEARRKTRVMFWGTIVGVVPVVIERGVVDFARLNPPLWLDAVMIAILFIFPLSFAYAVVKHRVLEIPVLLKRSARYVFVRRGFAVLLVLLALGANILLTFGFSHFLRANTQLAMSLGVGFGISLAIVAAPLVRRSTDRIDRAFFRSAYDARVILEDLAQKTRTVTDRHELASLLVGHIEGALRPKTLVCFLEREDGALRAEAGVDSTALSTLPPLRADLPLLQQLLAREKSWDLLSFPPDAIDLAPLAALAPECLVPFIARDGHLLGLLVLGQRLSEEPYSGEDRHLLDSVANQAAVALENIGLAEKMAERMDADRRAAQEMEIAREVQARLFPQRQPAVATLDYAGGCLQARTVGGDYFDFLDLGAGRIGIVLADISGKGMSGALLMANLQANLRSQYARASDDLPGLLRSVNCLFYENSPDNSYATMFFAVYEGASRTLRYVNGGHNAPLLLRANGVAEWLGATSTVVGLFAEWDCEASEAVLAPGDLLVMYTDGVSEAPNPGGEEFSEARLLDVVRAHAAAPPAAILDAVRNAVLEFSEGAQADDITLVVARAR